GLVKSGSKLPPYQFTYKHNVFDQKKISFQIQKEELFAALIDDFDGNRVIEQIGWDTIKKKEGRDEYSYTCEPKPIANTPSNEALIKNSCQYYLDKIWTTQRRSDLNKYKKQLFFYDYEVCRENSRGRERCHRYSNTGELFEKTSRIADFDGDGKEDVISDNKQEFTKAIDQTWSNIKGSKIFDVNGDGRADLGELDAKYLYTRISNGTSGFISLPRTRMYSGLIFGDFNGDGLTDLFYSKGEHDRQIYFSSGLKFIAGPVIHSSSLGDILSDSVLVADVNGDGRADYIGNRKRDHTRLFLMRGDTLFHYHTEGHGDLIRDYPTAIMADADGDGFIDFITHGKKITAGFDGRATKLISERPDMLVGVVLPSGGQLSASYTTYGGDPEDERWFPPVLTVLAALTEKPNSSQAFTTRFAYSGGRWDFDNRRFAGFKQIITTLPKLAGETKAPTVETTYR
ncbi:FG-GAP-like repeat-containing protein, partial [Pseudovibrio denitrificans]